VDQADLAWRKGLRMADSYEAGGVDRCYCGAKTLRSWWTSTTDAGQDGTDRMRHERTSCLTRAQRVALCPPGLKDADTMNNTELLLQCHLGQATYDGRVWAYSGEPVKDPRCLPDHRGPPPGRQSAECPCGINRTMCEYHREA
jgi:hypothetical protein